jgi:hypothetical protein
MFPALSTNKFKNNLEQLRVVGIRCRRGIPMRDDADSASSSQLASLPVQNPNSRPRPWQPRRKRQSRRSTTSTPRAFGGNSVSWTTLKSRNTTHSLAGELVAVNPEISSGLPLPTQHRVPAPASRPEKYSTPATKGSKFVPRGGGGIKCELCSFGPRSESLLET